MKHMTKQEILNKEIVVLSQTIKVPFVEKYILEGTRVRALGYCKEGLHVKVRIISLDQTDKKSKLPYAVFNEVYAVAPSFLK